MCARAGWITGFTILVCCAFAAGAGRASPFLQPPVEGQLIVSGSFESADRYLDRQGRLRAVSDYRKFELKAYVKYGATSWLTLAAAQSYSSARFSAPAGRDSIAMTEAAARFRIWNNETHFIAMQAGVRAPIILDRGIPGLAREVFEADARLMYGMKFKLASLDAFASLEAGYRLRAALADEYRLDATLGLHLNESWMLLAQSFNIFARRDNVFAEKRSHKIQASAVWRFDPRWALQLGAYHMVSARNARRESGVLMAVWRRF